MKRLWPKLYLITLTVLLILFIRFQGPVMLGDSPTYLDALNVLNGGLPSPIFFPNRILTTFLGLHLLDLFTHLWGSVEAGWFFMNSIFYFLACIFFFKLLVRMFQSEKVAYLGAVFLAANYGFFIFGLNHLMDIGGWAFYILSIYFLYLYSQSGARKDLLLSALMIAVGGFFKEYAFLAALAIAVYLIIENLKDLKALLAKASQTAAIVIVPTAIFYAYVYHRFGYTYLDWFGANVTHYIYPSRFREFIKTLGSLYTFLAFPVLGGVYLVMKKWRDTDTRLKAYLAGVAVSFLPIFFWPAITQRIVSITVPFAIMVACFCFKRYERFFWLWVTLLVVYILATFLMYPYILNLVNVPF